MRLGSLKYAFPVLFFGVPAICLGDIVGASPSFDYDIPAGGDVFTLGNEISLEYALSSDPSTAGFASGSYSYNSTSIRAQAKAFAQTNSSSSPGAGVAVTVEVSVDFHVNAPAAYLLEAYGDWSTTPNSGYTAFMLTEAAASLNDSNGMVAGYDSQGGGSSATSGGTIYGGVSAAIPYRGYLMPGKTYTIYAGAAVSESNGTSKVGWDLDPVSSYLQVTSSLPGDINGDGIVGPLDIAVINGHFNQTGQTYATGDLNGDGTVDQDDLDIANGNLGEIIATGGASLMKGDFNFDGVFDAGDIDNFVAALDDASPFSQFISDNQTAFTTLLPGQTLSSDVVDFIGDFDDDGIFDAGDIDGFVDALLGSRPAASVVPEPAALSLFAIAAPLLARRRPRVTTRRLSAL